MTRSWTCGPTRRLISASSRFSACGWVFSWKERQFLGASSPCHRRLQFTALMQADL
jgi:hypothetical protein